ncbi:unnamed protein product, partial [Ectocarpus sp. 12 AP-2014]
RSAVEALGSITTAAVYRDFAVTPVGRESGDDAGEILLDLTFGSQSVQCSSDNADLASCDFTFSACQLVRLEDVWYRVKASFQPDGSGQIPLAEEHDCSVTASYKGDTKTGSTPYAWAYGYEWTIHILSYVGTLGPISSPMHSLYPADSAVLYISGSDCESCLYIPNDGSSLTMGTPYYVRIAAYNALGASEIGSGSDDSSLVVGVVPNQIPFAPTDVSVTVVSGSRLEVFFCDPLISSGDIRGFLVQWDTEEGFEQAIGGGN